MSRALRLSEDRFALARLPAGSAPPSWAGVAGAAFVARTPDEVSLLLPHGSLPANVPAAATDFRGLRVAAPMSLDEVGVLAELTAVLAGARLPLLAVSTHDTDWLFVREEALMRAVLALEEAGHAVEVASRAMPFGAPRVEPAGRDDLPAIAALAAQVWRAHYPGIISHAQIDYMLGQRYNQRALAAEIERPGHWLDQVRVGGARVAFANYFVTEDPRRMKLDKLYLHPRLHGLGYGAALLAHAAARARAEGCAELVLAVNKGNAKAIAAYRRAGFEVREAVRVDIGGGFAMDDYVMARTLATLDVPAPALG